VSGIRRQAYTRDSPMKFRSHRWLVWLLPFLVARALVPTGFMLSAGADGLSLAFCPGTTAMGQFAAVQQDAHADHSAHAEHQQHAQHHSGDSQSHSDHFSASDTGVCPFAVAAATSAGADFYLANVAVDSTLDLLPDYTAPPHANRPIRADRIRGPPNVSLT
jgi:hypothetical protein